MRTVGKFLAIGLTAAAVAAAAPGARSNAAATTAAGGAATRAHSPAATAKAALDRAQALEKQKRLPEALAAGYQAVEADPDWLAAHDWLTGFPERRIDEVFEDNKDPAQLNERLKEFEPRLQSLRKTIESRYLAWLQRFPDSAGMLYGMGKHLSIQEKPEARAYLLKFIARDPGHADVFQMLAVDALNAGDKPAAAGYFRRAMALEPGNARYALSYARSLDSTRRTAALQDVLRRFPGSEAGISALGTLSDEAPDEAHRVGYLEQLRHLYAPGKSDRISYSMGTLFEIYLRTDPAAAVRLAQQMQGGPAAKDWQGRLELAQALVTINQKLAAGKGAEALALLDKLKSSGSTENTAMVGRVKARVTAAAGQPQSAYQALLQLQARTPDDDTWAAVQALGTQLHKTTAQVRADARAAVYAHARPAPAFDLQKYTSDDKVSLAGLRGKVVLLTFWFPGCAPCAAEFPHFEAVMQRVRQHSGDVAYLGVNIVREQDSYVLTRMQNYRYTFTPLKGTEAVQSQDKGYAVVGAPSNFLIDRSGKVVYSKFMISSPWDEKMLQRMIESVL